MKRNYVAFLVPFAFKESLIKLKELLSFFFVGLLFFTLTGNGVQCQNSYMDQIIEWPEGNHTITEPFYVYPEDELVIHPGAKVNFTNPNSKLVIYGKLVAIGSADKPIELYSDHIDGWGGIEIANSLPTIFECCYISDINRGLATSGEDIVNRGGIYVSMTENVSFTNCLYYSNKGGIVVINESPNQNIDFVIQSCLFENNEVGGHFRGVVFISQSVNLLAANSTFNNNRTNLDGLISINSGSTAILLNNEFSRTNYFATNHTQATIRGYPVIFSLAGQLHSNHLVANGNHFHKNIGDFTQSDVSMREIVIIGELSNYSSIERSVAFLWNNIFEGNLFNQKAKKTAIHARYTKLTVSNCTIKYYNGNGLFLNYSDAKIHGNFFENNRTEKGAVYFGTYDGYSGIFIQNKLEANIFKNNRSPDGGAVYIDIEPNEHCHTEIFGNNLFLLNSATTANGGVIYANATGNLLIRNNNFEQNTAQSHGGAIHLKNPGNNILIKQNTFLENTAMESGGAISIDELAKRDNSVVELLENDFIFNDSFDYGGAAFLSQTGVKFEGNNLHGNNAAYGGGFYAMELAPQSVFISNFISNNKAIDGGGFYLKEVNNDEDLVRFEDNVIRYNKYEEKGGGGFIENCQNIKFIRDLYAFNTYYNESNLTSSGGGIYVFNSDVEFYNCNILSNTQKNVAGAYININADNKFKLINCNVVNHDFYGGVAFTGDESSENIEIQNTIFWGNAGNSIIDESNPIPVTNYCFFDVLPSPSQYHNIFQLGIWPGWYSLINFYLDCDNLPDIRCIDKGNPNPIYNDNICSGLAVFPSCKSDTNDIGVTGGPYASNENTFLFEPTATIQPEFIVRIVCPINKIVHIIEKSHFPNDANDPHQYQWHFGDGYHTMVSDYDGNSDFIYEYDKSIERATIVFTLIKGNEKLFFSQEVVFKQNVDAFDYKIKEDEPTDEESLTAINPNMVNCSMFTVFPNPTAGNLTINFHENENKIFDIKIYSNIGILLKSFINLNHQSRIELNLEDLPSGIYFLIITSENNTEIRKILKN